MFIACSFKGAGSRDLSWNKIQTIAQYSFVDLSSLKQLNLSSNQIQTISEYSFVNLTALEQFDLSSNKIQTISQYSFVNLIALHKLNLSKQQIHTIEEYSFVNLANVEYLQLEYNNLTVIKSYTFLDMDNLYLLNLYGNNISLIENDAFVRNPHLKYLNLTLNSLNCGCDIIPFWAWLNKTAVNVTSATCSEGRDVNSIRLSELKNCNTSLAVSAAITSYNKTIGMNVTLNCVVTSGIVKNITWYKDNTTINLSTDNGHSGGTVQDPSLTIINVKQSDKGSYVCQATDLVDNFVNTLTISLVVRAPLAVIALITSYNPTIETNVTLNCDLTSGIATNITWCKDNTTIDFSADYRYSGGTVQKPQLTIINVQQSDQGSYFCQASDSVEIVYARIISVFVRAPLIVRALITSYNPTIGTNVTINCNLTSGIATTITWYKDNTPIDLLPNYRHSGGTVQKPPLTIINVQLSDQGSYVCQARDSVEIVYTNTIAVAVRASLVVRALITSYNSTIGKNVSLNCNIASGIATNITWYKDNTTIDLSTNKRYSGGTVKKPPLIIINVQQSDQGSYVCQARDSVEIVYSQTISVAVRAPLIVRALITSYNPTIGTNVTLNCNLTSGIATNITWYKDNTTIDLSPNYRHSGGTVQKPPLTIINVQLSDQGAYVCQARDSVEIVSTNTIAVAVRAPLIVRAHITSYSPTIGTNVTLNCDITSGIATNISWYKDNTTIDLSTNDRYSGGRVQKPPLTIIKVQQSDQGSYVCQAKDSVEIVYTLTIAVVVRAPLTVRANNTSYNPRFGTNVTLNCDVISGIATDIIWYKDNSTIILSNKNRYVGGTVQTPPLTVISLQQSDQGSYICQAGDSVETVYTHTITLAVRVYCDGRSYHLDWGIVSFPSESYGSSISSTEDCITDKKPLATADCIAINGQLPSLLNIVINPKCIFNTFEHSPVTKSIQNLTTISVDNNNVQAIVESVRNLTSDPTNLTSIDIISVAEVLVHISNLPVISEKVVNNIFDIIDSMINVDVVKRETAQNNGSATNRFLEVLNNVSKALDLGGQTAARFLRDNILMDVYDVSYMKYPVIGIQIESGELEPLSNNTVKTITYVDEVNVETVDAAIILPVELIKGINNSTRVSLIIYRNLNLFSVRSDIIQYRPNSRIIAASIIRNGIPVHSLGKYKVQALFYPRVNTSVVVCEYWDYALHENSGGWATDGCELNRIESGRLVCICDHLTNFAVLVNIGGQDTLSDSPALKTITFIGLILSIVGLSLTVLSLLVLKHLRKGRGQHTLFNLALSLLCFLIVFITGIEQTHDFYGCIAVSVLLHYFILVAFMWMLIEGVLQYSISVPNSIPNFMLKTTVPAWCVPIITVIIVLALDHKLYYGGSKACWMSLSAFYYSFVVPVSLIVLANIIIFIMILRNRLCRPKDLDVNQSKKNKAMKNLCETLPVFVLLGLTWIFGFLTIEGASVMFQYIFTMLNVLQGFVIFVLFTMREKTVRDDWKKLCCKQKSRDRYSKTDTSSIEYNSNIRNKKLFINTRSRGADFFSVSSI